MAALKLVVPDFTAAVFGPGKRCLVASPGDIVLVRHSGFVAKGIRFFERIRAGASRPYCWTNHAAVVLKGGPAATIAQETAKGQVISPLAAFTDCTYAVVNLRVASVQKEAAVDFATAAVGSGYGYLQIPADAFNAITGLELCLGIGDRMTCSTATTRALERMGLIPDRQPGAVTPAHIARYFQVRLP